MLSDAEQHQLAEIESGLEYDDSTFVRRFTPHSCDGDGGGTVGRPGSRSSRTDGGGGDLS